MKAEETTGLWAEEIENAAQAPGSLPPPLPPLPCPPARQAVRDVRRQIQEFIRSGRRILLLPRDPTIDVISHWKKVRSPLRTIFNTFIVGLGKLSPWMRPKLFLFRSFLGMKIGRGVGIAPIDIGPLFPELISIGDNSAIGWKATIVCHLFTQSRVVIGRVDIGRNVLIGGFTGVCPGVTIGDNAVVQTCSLVDRDIPPAEVWGGIPIRRIQKLVKPM